MFEARHTMDAPATTSADNGTSGGGDGWFKPRKQPASGPGTESQGSEQGAALRGTEPQATEGRRLAGLRPVGRGTASAGAAGSGAAGFGGGLPQDAGRPDSHHPDTAHPDTARPDFGARITAPPAPVPSDPGTTVLPKLIPAPATAVPPLVSTSRPSTDTFAVPESLQVPAQRTAPSEPLPAEAAHVTAPPEEQHRAEGQHLAEEQHRVEGQHRTGDQHRAENPLAAPHPEPGSFRQFAEEGPRTEAEPDSDLDADPEFFRPFIQEPPRPEAESAPEHSRPLPHEAPRPEPGPEAAQPFLHEAARPESGSAQLFPHGTTRPGSDSGPEAARLLPHEAARPQPGPEAPQPFPHEGTRPEPDSAPETPQPFSYEAPRPESGPEAAHPLPPKAPQAEAEPLQAYTPDAPEPAPEPSGSFVPDAFRPAVGFSRASAPDVLQDESLEAAPEPFRAFGAGSLEGAEPAPEGSPDAVLVRRTMAAIGEVSDKVTSYFYALLFVRHPDLRPLFPPAMDAQRDRLLKALLTAAEHVDNTPVLVEYLQNLGRGHRKYGTRAEHYPAVGECLIGALAKYAQSVWNPETEAAWVRTYTTISQVMIDAAAVDELRAPPWWQAEVVSHELRTQDIAVITVRPNQPYPFLAGQYASLETPWWPRIWRHYSFASAPRSDGLLSFHVKAVPAGWVSNALVHRAHPGDVIRLGPPAGTMTVDHTRDSGLLCLGGGTGIAPIKALVEDVAEHGTRRRMEVFYGARTDHDLYDIDTMLRLQQSHSWLEVRPVVDKHGLLQLPDAIRTFGPWDEYDAYLSGPVGMIRSGVDALRGAGIPKERIRHDSVAELVAAG
ncbi:globin domain-containing protein [Streptomyces acidiscabies]|uniref:globin domain-containing protein n=1 Tax=Streptomyces acidiscabies TaxID=42234 RepID=UPI0034C5C09A